MLEKRMQEIESRKLEIRSVLESGDQVNFDEVKAELEALEAEKRSIVERQEVAAQIQTGEVEARQITKPKEVEKTMEFTKDNVLASAEYRSAFFKSLQGKKLEEVEERALTTAVNSAGAAVPTTTLNLVVDKLRQVSALYSLVSVSMIPGNVSFTVANAKNAASWKAEGTDGTPADDTVVKVTLAGYELIKLVEISAAAQAMTIDAFEAYIAEELGRQMAIAIENAILNGDGADEPTGILNGITWDATNSATFTTSLKYDDVIVAPTLLPTAYHPNAVFVMNRKTLFGGIRKIKTTDGLPLFAYNAQDKFAGTIFGYNVVVDDYIADDVILFGDLSYYKLNFSQMPTIETSTEAGFKSGKKVYRGLAVADGKPALGEAFVKISKA